MKNLILCLKINALIMFFISVYAFIIPTFIIVYNLQDEGLHSNKVPHCVFYWHKALSPKFEKWAKERVKTGAAAKLSTLDVSGTEWPIFSSVFYLWATEAIQEAYQENPKLASSAPKDYACGAIDAAAALIVDANHASGSNGIGAIIILKKKISSIECYLYLA
jgi:hypothetical protein